MSTGGSLDAGIEVLLAGEWIRWGATYHLWFLAALLLYTGLALILRSLMHSLPDRLTATASASARPLIATQPRVVLLSALAVATLIPAYAYSDGGAESAAMQLHLMSFFLIGWMFFVHRDQIDRLKDGAWRAIAIAVACVPVATWSARQRWLAPDDVDVTMGVIAGVSNGIMVAAMSYGLLGLFQRRYDQRPSSVGQYISDASYWIFLIHFPLLIFVSGVLSAVALPAIVKYLITVGVVAPIVFATYHFLVRNALLGRLLKGRKRAAANT